MFDRLGLVTQRLLSAKHPDLLGHNIDGLRDVRVGMNLATLRRSSDDLPPALRKSITSVESAVSEAYRELIKGESLTHPDSARSIDRGIAAFTAQGRTHAVEDGVTALVGLRLDLTSFGSRYVSEPLDP
jgi:hypothetical protein